MERRYKKNQKEMMEAKRKNFLEKKNLLKICLYVCVSYCRNWRPSSASVIGEAAVKNVPDKATLGSIQDGSFIFLLLWLVCFSSSSGRLGGWTMRSAPVPFSYSSSSSLSPS
jgi:hypothetical protein